MADQREVNDARRVSILLATYNGDRFLEQQLASLAAQDWPSIDIWASDDGSTDGTMEILRRWQEKWNKGKFSIASGPRKGFAENFRSLLANRDINTGFVAFSDQDDVWDSDKLSAAIDRLAQCGQDHPSLYCSRTRLVDEEGQPIGLSPLFGRAPAFRNAIVQSIGGGNTIVMNRPAFRVVSESARRTAFVTHDWWSYLMISGVGGTVYYDPAPRIAYRQHRSNLVGHNMGFRAKAHRLRLLINSQFAIWNATNLAALALCEDLLTEENRAVMKEFARIRSLAFPANLMALRRLGLYRQNLQGDVTLIIAAAIRKL